MAEPARVCGLRVEGLENPLGLETERPRLSWRLESGKPGARQSAYRVRVSDTRRALAEGRAELWDSGRVATGRSADVAYEGRPLPSRARAWWTVDVWDDAGELAEAAAQPAWWETGLLSPEDWRASWVAVETTAEAADREAGLEWVWDGAESEEARRLLLDVTLATAARATLFAIARGRIAALSIDGRPLEPSPFNPYAFGRAGAIRRDLGDLAPGEHQLTAEVVTTGRQRDPRPWRGGFAALLRLELANGETLRVKTGPEWLISRADEPAWAPAAELGGRPSNGWPPGRAMLLRQRFELSERPVAARLYATALGAYEAFLNGEPVGDALLAPESTDFRRRVLYQVHDVADRLDVGENVLAAHVGDGWYASVFAPAGRYAFGPPPRRFLAQLEMTFADGSRRTVATGPDWCAHPSAVVSSELYDGEVFDARNEIAGWDKPGFDDAGWEPAAAVDAPPARLAAQVSPPIRVLKVLRAAAINEPRPGVYVVDFGQNFAGLCQIRIKGAAGTAVTLRFAEILLENGEVDQANLRAARATDVYVLKGDPVGETWRPSFTFHGFRYVQVEGWPGRPGEADVEGLVLHSDLPVTGAFRTEQPIVEQLWRNALWSQRSNFVGVPTDCPQRDERLGWLGDACVFWDAAAFNMDVEAFTHRFMGDIRDAQGPGGGFSDFAPAARRFNEEPAPGWADAGVVLPWTVWRRYGSTSIIDENWEAMTRYIAFVEAANPDFVWSNRRGLDFGDWLALDARQPGDPTTPKDLIGTAWWAHSANLLAEMGEVVGRPSEAERLRSLEASIRAAFQARFVRPDGEIGNGSQTGYILALKFGLLPEELRPAAAERLVADIIRRGKVLSTGFLGTPFSLDVLADMGRVDLVYDLLLRTEFPSWGYMVARGATTIWERWNGDTGDIAMNSFNHYALGAVAGFLFRRIAGIDATEPGFRRIVVRPVLDPRLRRAGADYDSVLGRISTDWAWTPGERFELALTVPPSAAAEVRLPAMLGAEARAGAIVSRTEGGELVLELGSGRHAISVAR
jgi:alpha-L-rhamnosidase